MHVIIIADHAEAEGGAPQVAIASAVALSRAGVGVTYLHGVGHDGSALLDRPGISRFGLGGTDIHAKSPVSALRDGIWNREPLETLSQILANAPPDTVVHVHQWTKYFSPSLFGLLRASGRPLVLSMHDYFAVCPTGLMYRFDRREPCTLEPLSARCCVTPCDPKSVLHKGVRVARGFALRKALGEKPLDIVHVSDVGRKTIGGFLPAAFRQHVIENPVEVPRQAAVKAANGTHLVYCGRLTTEKGVELVAEAARDVGMPSLFIGDGPATAAIRAIDPKAEITGWLSRDAVRNRLARDARALVAPSLWPETGPLVIAEAQALGLPVIVSERAGASGRVAHRHDGFVVAPERAAIAQALAALANPDTAAAMGATAYARYWANPPSPEAHARHLLKVYESALQQDATGK